MLLASKSLEGATRLLLFQAYPRVPHVCVRSVICSIQTAPLNPRPPQGNAGERQALLPLTVLILEETTVINRLLLDMQHMLQDCEAAILRGSAFCSSSPWVQAAAHCILEGRIPPHWAAVFGDPTSLSLSSWVLNVQRRASQLHGFAASPPERFPLIWLPGFRRPRSVIAAASMYITWHDGIPSHRCAPVDTSPSVQQE